MWGIRAFRSIRIFVLLVLSTFLGPAWASAKTAKTPPSQVQAPSLSIREQALRTLNSVPESTEESTPQIMMPLNDTYKSAERRFWDWMIEASVSQRSLEIPAPAGSYGPVNTGSLSPFTFLEAGAGLSKNINRFDISLLGRASTSVKQSEFQLPSGASRPLRYQWISYGVEPRISWNFAGRTSLLASIVSDQVSFIQSSSESELVQGTQSFRENAARLGLQYDFDGNSYTLLTVKNYSNDFSSGTTWSLGVGAKW